LIQEIVEWNGWNVFVARVSMILALGYCVLAIFADIG